jgi:thiol-disulfide isomerase/thioredoxin
MERRASSSRQTDVARLATTQKVRQFVFRAQSSLEVTSVPLFSCFTSRARGDLSLSQTEYSFRSPATSSGFHSVCSFLTVCLRSDAMCYPSGAKFPWRPKPLFDILRQAEDHQGQRISLDDIRCVFFLSLVLAPSCIASSGLTPTCRARSDVIGLYFSAHWCPPCRGFTPHLAETYDAIRD